LGINRLGINRLIPKLVIVTEIIAPYRIPVFNALAQRNELDLHVIFLSENDLSLRQWNVYKEEIKFRYDVLPSWRWRPRGYNILINRGVSAALNKIQPDAVMCGGYNYLASWQCAYWARRHRVPLLLWSESTAADRRSGLHVVERMKARFLSMCTAFVVPGKSSFGYLRSRGIPDHRIFTAPNAVDVALFSSLAEQARRDETSVRERLSLPSRYFLFVGRLVRAKGVFDVVDAYAKLDGDLRAKIGLVFVGDGPDRSELLEHIAQIKCRAIQFEGFVQREGLPSFYALADALVFPTYSDTWGLVVNEAMSCGLPAIVSNVAGCAADLVQEGRTGLLVTPGGVPNLASAMALLANDSTLRREMASTSRENIDAFSPDVWAEGMVKATEYVCEKKK
jgi:glycosyltransferase involved in cell wall biosynthesis